ncbi:MAG: TIGR00159 family protein [Bacteroidetes bacterium]|nr:TIGR00159 family protein [Bacteroidota bacterium]
MTPYLIDIGFFSVRVWDILDIVITGYVIYLVYRLLRGSIAMNIFIGVVLLYIFWWLVKTLEMDLLGLILGQFVSIGVIVLIIIFQPEVRRFLLLLGNTTIKRRSRFLNVLFPSSIDESSFDQSDILALKAALVKMAKRKTGALIVVADSMNLLTVSESGVKVDAAISQSLLESIFHKESPLHDGAVVVSGGRIKTASAIMPVSENPDLPRSVGLRHRAAVGATEGTTALAFIVSEENGKISYAKEGRLVRNLNEEELYEVLSRYATN